MLKPFRSCSAAIIFVVLSVLAARAEAQNTVSENFMNPVDIFSSPVMVWNLALGMLHPPLQISGWSPGVGTTNFSVGDGHHGPFNIATYAIFSVGGSLAGN